MKRSMRVHPAILIACALGVVACSSDDEPVGEDGGAGSGGAMAGTGGGNSAGGNTANGGSTTSAGGGGTPSSGGAMTSVGGTTPGSGGTPSSGGSTSSSGGGPPSSGGTAPGAGGAPPDSGAPDGGAGRHYSTNRDDFFGASRCAKAGVLFCDDFEAAAIDNQRWKTKFSAPSLDATRAARGKQALHLKTTATSGSGVETTKLFPAPSNTYYGRLFVYFDTLPTAPSGAHWTIVGANPTSASPIKGEIRVGGQHDGTANRWGIGTDGGPTGDWTNHDKDPNGKPAAAPEKTWACIEWMHAGGTNETRFWWDGVEHPSLATTRDLKHGANATVKYDLPTFGSVWVGWVNYNQGKTVAPDHFDTWIDEVAFDDERIGCEI
jgi:hypothetical protein